MSLPAVAIVPRHPICDLTRLTSSRRRKGWFGSGKKAADAVVPPLVAENDVITKIIRLLPALITIARSAQPKSEDVLLQVCKALLPESFFQAYPDLLDTLLLVKRCFGNRRAPLREEDVRALLVLYSTAIDAPEPIVPPAPAVQEDGKNPVLNQPKVTIDQDAKGALGEKDAKQLVFGG